MRNSAVGDLARHSRAGVWLPNNYRGSLEFRARNGNRFADPAACARRVRRAIFSALPLPAV